MGSVGARGYRDYPTLLQTKGPLHANERRRLYRIRHKKDMQKKGSNGYYAANLLW